MENLKNYGVQELSLYEQKETDGGILGFLAGYLVGVALAMILFDK